MASAHRSQPVGLSWFVSGTTGIMEGDSYTAWVLLLSSTLALMSPNVVPSAEQPAQREESSFTATATAGESEPQPRADVACTSSRDALIFSGLVSGSVTWIL